jgi:acetyl-CoA C-acetyltransferase
MSAEKAKQLGLTPKARIVASTVAAIRPEIMGLGPIPAIQALLKEAGVTIDDVDVVEINEAFAAQIVPCKDELGIPDEKLNPFGGAIALGHPFGMTGARIMTTLINGLARSTARSGSSRCASPAGWARRCWSSGSARRGLGRSRDRRRRRPRQPPAVG